MQHLAAIEQRRRALPVPGRSPCHAQTHTMVRVATALPSRRSKGGLAFWYNEASLAAPLTQKEREAPAHGAIIPSQPKLNELDGVAHFLPMHCRLFPHLHWI